MISKTLSAVPGRVHIIFELPSCVWADHIYLIGEFNDWNQGSIPMKQTRAGIWRAELDLPCGRTYEFRYLADGRWLTDNHADGFTTNSFGTQNSIVDTTLPIAFLQIGEQELPSVPVWWHKERQWAHKD